MRLAIVGSTEARARLRAQLAETGIEIVGEFSDLTSARMAVNAEAILIASDDGTSVRALFERPDGNYGGSARRPGAVGRFRATDPPGGGPRPTHQDAGKNRPTRRAVTDDGDETANGGMPESLTSREMEVLELLAHGLPNKAIAAKLGISDQTVKFHVASISGKLGAANRTDAVRRAVRRGLLTL